MSSNVRCYSVKLAQSIGEKPAMMLHQIDFWASKSKIGYIHEGRKYVRNTLNGWLSPENFPHWSLMTVRRVLNKLVDEGLLVRKQVGHKWDQTLGYSVEYSHPLLIEAGYSIGIQEEVPKEVNQSEQIEMSEENKSSCSKRTNPVVHLEQVKKYIQYPKDNSRENLQRGQVSSSFTASVTDSKQYRLDYPLAESWLTSREKKFRDKVEVYLGMHCNKKEVKFPQAVRMKIIVEIWKKFNGMPNKTDFDYVDHSQLKEHDLSIETCRRLSSEELLDIEMESCHGEDYNRKFA